MHHIAEKGLPASKVPPTPKATRSKISDQAKATDQTKRREIQRTPPKQNLQIESSKSRCSIRTMNGSVVPVDHSQDCCIIFFYQLTDIVYSLTIYSCYKHDSQNHEQYWDFPWLFHQIFRPLHQPLVLHQIFYIFLILMNMLHMLLNIETIG